MSSCTCTLIIALLASCSKAENDDAGALIGEWKLESLDSGSGDPITYPSDEVYLFEFAEDGSVSAIGACNDCGGTYDTGPGGSLSIEISCTESACDRLPCVGSAINHRATSYKVDGSTLRIYFTNRSGEEGVLYLTAN